LPSKKANTLGFVGESGCGKTTVARTLLRLIDATSGNVYFEGKDVLEGFTPRPQSVAAQNADYSPRPLRFTRPPPDCRRRASPTLVIHKIGDRQSQFAKVQAVMDKVGLSPSLLERFPHEFSGGQRQRIRDRPKPLVMEPSLLATLTNQSRRSM
jgi:ABC-type oligopeptide transport system ATPase subunit